MKMVKFSILAAGLLTCLNLFAGPNDGGGGQGVVCRNPDKSIKSVELLDLWEAREVHERKIQDLSNESVENIAAVMIERLKNISPFPWQIGGSINDPRERKFAEAMAWELEREVSSFLKGYWNVNRLRGKKLTKTHDAYEEVEPNDEQGCAIEQVVRYRDFGNGSIKNILLNDDLVDQMDNTNKAALYLHEAMYSVLRKFGEKTSLRTRRAIGFVFSGESFQPLGDLISKPHIVCENINFGLNVSTTRVYFTSSSHNMVAFVPTKINDQLITGFTEDVLRSGTPMSITKYYKTLARGGLGGGARLSSSPTDFDMSVKYQTLGKHRLRVWIDKSANGTDLKQPQDLNCQLVNGPYQDRTY